MNLGYASRLGNHAVADETSSRTLILRRQREIISVSLRDKSDEAIQPTFLPFVFPTTHVPPDFPTQEPPTPRVPLVQTQSFSF